jgi:hypothetical protein
MKPIVAILLVLCVGRPAFAMASTDIIEGPMENSTVALYGFPDNALPLINDWHRFWAWHPWFSELPNAAYFFAYSAATLNDVNELLGYFGEIHAKELVIELDPSAQSGVERAKSKDKPEPGPLTLCLVSKSALDHWFDHLDEKGKKKFGVTERPQPSPPTMTIHVGHELIDLEELKLPSNVTVTAQISDWQRKDPKLAKTIEKIEKFMAEHYPTTAPRTNAR